MSEAGIFEEEKIEYLPDIDKDDNGEFNPRIEVTDESLGDRFFQ